MSILLTLFKEMNELARALALLAYVGTLALVQAGMAWIEAKTMPSAGHTPQRT